MYIDEFPNCCGVGVVTELEFVMNDDDYYYEQEENYYEKHGTTIGFKYKPMKKNKAYYKSVMKNLKDLLNDSGFKCVYTSITDKSKQEFKELDKALRRMKWKETSKSKSNHGKYFIHVYVWKKPQRRTKKKK